MKCDRGLIRFLILVFIALVVLGYYGISVRQVVQKPTTQDNINYVWTGAVSVWDDYLRVPASYLWNIFVNLIWVPAIINLESIKNGQPMDLQKNPPALPYPVGN